MIFNDRLFRPQLTRRAYTTAGIGCMNSGGTHMGTCGVGLIVFKTQALQAASSKQAASKQASRVQIVTEK